MPNLYAVLAVIALIAIGYGYVQYLRADNAKLSSKNKRLEREYAILSKEFVIQQNMHEASKIRDRAANDARIESALRAEREKQRVTAERLSAASQKKAKLVERLAGKAIENNVGVLNCKSDLRDTRKECGNVR